MAKIRRTGNTMANIRKTVKTMAEIRRYFRKKLLPKLERQTKITSH